MALVTSNISGSAKATSARSGDGDTLRHGGVGLTGSLYIASAQEGTAKSQGGIIFGKVAANITPGTSSGSLFCKNVAGSAQLFWYDGSTATNLVAGSSIDGSGAANRMTYWTDSNTLSSIDDLIYNGTDLQVGNGDDTKLYFRDGGIYIFSDANGDLSLVADDQIKLSATGSIPITVGAAGVVIQGTTPKLTIGDAGAEDTFLVFDGNAQDYRIGLDDGTDKLEIGVGATHGTTTAITVDSSQLVAMQAAATVGTTLGVTGISTFTADLVCNGGDITNGTTGNANNIFATSTGKVTLGGGAIDLGATSTATTVKGTLNVDEAVTLDTTLGCAGAVDFDTTLNVDGASTMGAITSDGAISTTSTLGVGGLATMGNVDIGGGNIDGTTIGAAVVAAGSFAAVVGTTATFSSTLTANGDVDLGDATGDTITATGRFDSDLVPSTDSARDLGTSVLQWADIHADAGYIDAMTITGDIGVGGTATFGGNVDLGNAIMDTVTFVARVDSNIVPSSDSAQDLGTSVLRWNNIYTGDLHLANDRGNYTMVEEEDMLTIRNNRTGKWYRMMMEEIDPSGRDDGMKGPAPVLAGDTDWEV